MKATAFLLAVAAASAAASDFPYYPEFADRFEAYDEVTPAMARAAAGEGEGEIVGEPLLLRDATGMPFRYMVASYADDDAAGGERWDDVIRKFNAGGRIAAAELVPEVEAFYAGEYAVPVRCYTLPAYTFEAGAIAGGFFPGLMGYPRAYNAAAAALDTGGLYFSRLIAYGAHREQIFEFEDDAGDKIAIFVSEHGHTSVANLEENAARMRAFVRGRYDWIKENPEKAARNHENWLRLAPPEGGGE